MHSKAKGCMLTLSFQKLSFHERKRLLILLIEKEWKCRLEEVYYISIETKTLEFNIVLFDNICTTPK